MPALANPEGYRGEPPVPLAPFGGAALTRSATLPISCTDASPVRGRCANALRDGNRQDGKWTHQDGGWTHPFGVRQSHKRGNQRQTPTEGNPPVVLAPQDRAASPLKLLSKIQSSKKRVIVNYFLILNL